MKLFTTLNNLVTKIRRVLQDMRGALDSELLDVPQQALDSFARMLLPKLQQFFESEEGKREFERWKLQQAELSPK